MCPEFYFSGLLHFSGLMQAIHLPIGLAEGVLTAAIVVLAQKIDLKKLSYGFGGISLVLAGFIAQYASSKPDGLEWSLLNISDSVMMQTEDVFYTVSEAIQAKSAILASISPAAGNLIGLFATGALMYLGCLLLSRKTVNENAL